MQNYVGDVLLLEEDHVPSPDIFLSLNFLVNMKNLSPLGECAGCWAVAMGGSSPCRPSSSAQEAWTLTCRHTQFVNTGLVFNRSIFHSVVASDFLAFRDGWDWSLYHVIQTQQMLRCQPGCSPRMLSPHGNKIAFAQKDDSFACSQPPLMLQGLKCLAHLNQHRTN